MPALKCATADAYAADPLPCARPHGERRNLRLLIPVDQQGGAPIELVRGPPTDAR